MAERLKRTHPRHPFRSRISHAFHNPVDHTKPDYNAYYQAHHDGLIHNLSEDGMCFETDYEIEPDRIIYVRLVDNAPGTFNPGVNEVVPARVIWCRKTSAGASGRYGVGVRFLTTAAH